MSNRYCLLLPSMRIGHHSFQDCLGATFFRRLWDIIVWADAEVCPGRSKPFAVDHGGGGSGGCVPASHNEVDICSSRTGPREKCETLRHNLARKSPGSFYSGNHLLKQHCGPTAIRHQNAGGPQENWDVVATKGLEHRDFARISIQIDESNWME